jgi:Tol biopolymer transport system component
VSDLKGGPPIRTEARGALAGEQFEAFHGLPTPDAWSGNRIVFHGHVGDSSNLWQAGIAPQTRRVSAPQRVTFGTTDEASASTTSGGRMVFHEPDERRDIWKLSIDTDRVRAQDTVTRLTQDLSDDYDPSISEDGRTLAFRSRRGGNFDVFSRDLVTGQETAVMATPADDYPVISPDGSRIAYSFSQNGKMPMFIVGLNGGAPEQVCDDCGEVDQWAPDGKTLLFVTARDPSVSASSSGFAAATRLVEASSLRIVQRPFVFGRRMGIVQRETDSLAAARVMVAKVNGASVVAETGWVVIAEDGDAPAWSPDGNVLYFWSNRDGSPCLWAQHLDPMTKRPKGSLVSVHHFHSRGCRGGICTSAHRTSRSRATKSFQSRRAYWQRLDDRPAPDTR